MKAWLNMNDDSKEVWSKIGKPKDQRVFVWNKKKTEGGAGEKLPVLEWKLLWRSQIFIGIEYSH